MLEQENQNKELLKELARKDSDFNDLRRKIENAHLILTEENNQGQAAVVA